MQKCRYCDFFSIPYEEAVATEYMTAVIQEIDLRKDQAGELLTIYLGGGTPTTLPTGSLIRLLGKIRASFRLSPDAEITIEANPGTITGESLHALAQGGINRLSLGIQSFDDQVLEMLGRIHGVSEALRSMEAARHAGITNVSVDLIYGIPGQTPESWSHQVTKAIGLSPEHLSAYELTPEEGTPIGEAIFRGECRKPDEEAIVEMYDHTVDRLTEAGYHHYEISNFGRLGFECRHNLNYWDRGEYIGIGAGAHSFIDDRRIRNASHIGGYIESLRKNRLAVAEELEVSGEEALKESLFLGLRKTAGLDMARLGSEFGVDLETAAGELISGGLLLAQKGHLRLTRRGIVLSNSVIARLFELLGLG